jgi:hypothetical protein
VTRVHVPLHGLVIVAAMASFAVPRAARAEAPSPELMARLAQYASHFETLRTQASYRVKGRYETLDGDGKADSVKAMEARLDPDGDTPALDVISYTEDGEDKTAQAQADARERRAKRKSDPNRKRVRMPLLAEQQPRYVFDQVQVDAQDPNRVRIAFTPKERGPETIEGSAWVDARTGTLISAGFKLSKTPTFVDYVHVTVQFGEPTQLGPAVSTVSIDGQGGLLFFRKRFHLSATLWDYRLAAPP